MNYFFEKNENHLIKWSVSTIRDVNSTREENDMMYKKSRIRSSQRFRPVCIGG